MHIYTYMHTTVHVYTYIYNPNYYTYKLGQHLYSNYALYFYFTHIIDS